ncbi:MAG: cbb3-type cytochrome oxidase assembly protein CcoS [Solitalea-like symbiont of Acarus siro]
MSSIVIMLALSLLVAGGFLIAFLWSIKKGQYDDTYTPSVRILFDEPDIKEKDELLNKSIDKLNNSVSNKVN